MKCHHLAIPGGGYCGYYSFAIGLIMSIKFNQFNLPAEFEKKLLIELNNKTVFDSEMDF